MPYATVDDIKMYYESAGEGEPLVFLHGFSLDHRQWRPQVLSLRENYRVITPDARGHGRSDAPLSGYSRADRVADLMALVDRLEINRFHLVGLSMGGATAIGTALNYPDRLKSLTLVSTGAAGYRFSKKFDKLDDKARNEGVEAALAKWREWALAWFKDDKQGLRDLLDSMMTDYSGAVWRDPMRGRYPKEQDLPRLDQIKLPTAIFTGDLDKAFATLAREIHTRIPSSTLHVYEQTGHMLTLEQPERFNADLKAFLEQA